MKQLLCVLMLPYAFIALIGDLMNKHQISKTARHIDPKKVNWFAIEAGHKQLLQGRNILARTVYNREMRHAVSLLPNSAKKWLFGSLALLLMLSIYLVYRDKESKDKDAKSLPVKILQKIVLIITAGFIKARF